MDVKTGQTLGGKVFIYLENVYVTLKGHLDKINLELDEDEEDESTYHVC